MRAFPFPPLPPVSPPALPLALTLALLCGLSACAPQPQPVAVVYPPMPPPPADMRPLPPVSARPLMWQPGHYDWTASSYVWEPGRYVDRQAAGSGLWQDGSWNAASNSWVPAHWN